MESIRYFTDYKSVMVSCLVNSKNSILSPPSAQQPVVGFAIAAGITLQDVLEQLADQFSHIVPHPQGYTVSTTSRRTRRPCLIAGENFSMAELQHALHACRKKGARDADGITAQDLKNLNHQ